jgi:hypothetical protein
MSLPAAGLAFNDYRLRTNNCKKWLIPHTEGGRSRAGVRLNYPTCGG